MTNVVLICPRVAILNPYRANFPLLRAKMRTRDAISIINWITVPLESQVEAATRFLAPSNESGIPVRLKTHAHSVTPRMILTTFTSSPPSRQDHYSGTYQPAGMLISKKNYFAIILHMFRYMRSPIASMSIVSSRTLNRSVPSMMALISKASASQSISLRISPFSWA